MCLFTKKTGTGVIAGMGSRHEGNRMKMQVAGGLTRLRDNVRLIYRGEPRAVDLALTALLSRGHIVLDDEINRATPKTQSALLEAMNEGAVTIESERRPLPQPFMVVATQNPVEYLGTYPLPESQMDRFFLRLSLGYPTQEEEKMLLRSGATEKALNAIPAVLAPEEVLELQDRVEAVTVSDRLLEYLHAVVRATRRAVDLRLPVSTRGAQALFRATQAYALMQGRDYATPDDVQAVAEPVLAHRILSLSSDGFGSGGHEREVVKKILAQVPVPL